MSDLIADYDFDLPPDLIADRPLAHRDASRMMVLDRASGQIAHRHFRDLPEYLSPGDLVVLNDSRVIKARLFSEDGRVEMLLLESFGQGRWKCLVKPGRRMRVGASCQVAGTTAHVRDVFPEGERLLEFASEPDLDKFGAIPIPPYFKREADAHDEERYQTVFAQAPGSVAAPTAGLHFTPDMLARVPHTHLTLHVGMGTFQPVKTPTLSAHPMHAERYTISEDAARDLNAATRILAVGTTCARVLESQPAGPFVSRSDTTSIFIRPPYAFRHVDMLLTNFHLPKSTLLALVSALAGRESVLAAYAEAIRERYRFFSYGDCMLIL